MTTIQNKNFNDEELLFLNRIAFISLIRHGAALTFNDFIAILTEFQNGDLSAITDLVVELLLEGRQDQNLIQIDMFTNLILSSIPQDTYNQTTPQRVLHSLFQDHNSEEACDQFITVEELKKRISQSNGNQKELL